MIISIFLLLSGCGADNENMDISGQESQPEVAVAEAASKDDGSGKDTEQTAEDAGSEKEIEQTAEDAETEEESAEETSWTGGSYMGAYRRFLESYVEENEYTQSARIVLAYIDDDNVPELLLIEDCIHPAMVNVYAYYQESVIELGEFGSFGSMQYVERGGNIFSGWSGMGEGVSNFYRVEDGEAKLICSIRSYEPFDGSLKTYEIDGVSAAEEEYDKKWEELYDTYEYTTISYDNAFAIQESEIKDVLDEAQNALLLQK